MPPAVILPSPFSLSSSSSSSLRLIHLVRLKQTRLSSLGSLPFFSYRKNSSSSSFSLSPRPVSYTRRQSAYLNATRLLPSLTRSIVTMATDDKSVDRLSEQLAQLPPLEKYPNCYPEINPVDIYRAHVRSCSGLPFSRTLTMMIHGYTDLCCAS